MEIVYNHWTGHPSQLNPTHCLGAYLRADEHHHVKVGITNNPEVRASQHAADMTWGKMVVIYETTSLGYVRQVESQLVDHLRTRCTATCNGANAVGGGGGNYGEGPYYVYILFSKKWNLRQA
ncbi:hypothetical protein NNJEOMEG_00759 [Fundidesulfovibrio magnetotacticus]|uniref:Uncharacterized protein n=1 Tax=Fundidesulfovibrio magnetotacticus TaxID=2730080 RepID=A0A6V8LQU8_9BACT|nr:hypothetical protein [Fundidesulfovibrio magnetotacticus]GFK92931.1 hypothetical protein NNJEOMEG_00759 [Fundidesulfovibrio magnetotacticus]